jgi:hypothetical protein
VKFIRMHMPKTGGTSLWEVLKLLADGEIFRDYDDIRLSNRPAYERDRHLSRPAPLVAPVIYGYFVLSKYASVRGQAFFWAIFREPAARLVSHCFQYLRKRGGSRNETLPIDPTLLDFAWPLEYCDMSRFLIGGVPVSEVDFVALTEALPRSARLLAAMLTGNPAAVDERKLGRVNCATECTDPMAYVRDQGIYDDVVAAQAVNMNVYEQARMRFGALCADYCV